MKKVGSVVALVVGLAWGEAAVGIDHWATRELEIRARTVDAGAAPVTGYQLWVTRDGGQTWERAGEPHAGAPPIPFTAPADGEYGFVVMARDRSGRGDDPPQPGTRPEYSCVVDTTAPYLEVRRPGGSGPLYAGSNLIFDYRVEDPNLAELPVHIEWRRVTDGVWQDIVAERRYPASSRDLQWWPSIVRGQIEVRVTATDLAGNVSRWIIEEPLTVVEFDGFTASRTVAADPYSAFRRFPIFYEIPGLSRVELRTVEIWWRHDSGAWQRATDPDRSSPFRFEASAEGQYFFYVRGVSHNDVANREPPGPDTAPDHRTVVDTLPPQGVVRVGAGAGTQYERSGVPLSIAWQVEDENLAPAHCRLEYSIDGGHGWHTLTGQLDFRAGVGEYLWRTPHVELEDLRVRLLARDLAGNESPIAADHPVHLINPTLDPVQAAEKHYRRGLYLARQGDEDSRRAAAELLGVSLTYDSSNPDVWHDRGVLSMMLDRPLAALADFRRAHELRPEDLGMIFSLVRAHVNLHRLGLEPGIDHLQAARELLAGVSRVDIYRQPNFRELLATYGLLEEAIAGE